MINQVFRVELLQNFKWDLQDSHVPANKYQQNSF